jgi:serine O-acetyltransferase
MKHANPITSRLLIWSTRHAPWSIRRIVGLIVGSDIACTLPNSTIIGHPFGIVIHSRTRVGENVTIMQNVTIGARRHGETEGAAIGDGAVIGAGAILLGPVHIGEGANVGAGSVVLHDVPPHATVAGNPARVVRPAPGAVQ